MDLDGHRYTEADEQPRWPLQTPIQIYIREDLPHLAGHSKDISLGGIHIEVGVKLPTSATITVEIYFQREDVFAFIEQIPLKVKGKVVWRKQLQGDYQIWDTGLSFTNITPAQQITLMEEVKNLTAI